MLDFLFWFIAIFAAIYGVWLLVAPKNALMPVFKKQLEKKGVANPTDEDLAKKLKQFRIYGIVCLVASAVLFYIQLTGGVFV